MREMDTKQILAVMESKGYAVFKDDSKPFNLNMIGIRSKDMTPDVYNDRLIYLWKYAGQWSLFSVPVTVDAGLYWLLNPMTSKGTALVKAGQYRGVWKLGKHRGKYTALVQKKPITVIRDGDSDAQIDLDSGSEETGFYGINHHRAGISVPKKEAKIAKYSAGCIVTSHPNVYEIEINLLKQAADFWGNSFTFTLLNEADFE